MSDPDRARDSNGGDLGAFSSGSASSRLGGTVAYQIGQLTYGSREAVDPLLLGAMPGSVRGCLLRVQEGCAYIAADAPARPDHFAGRFDLAAPAAGRDVAALDELLEPLEVALHPALHDVPGVARLLHDALWLELQPQPDPGPGGVHRVREEHHHAVVLRAADRAPRDLLVRRLVDDLRIPLTGDAQDAGLPVQPLGVELPDLLDTLHELRKLLELGPLVVGDGDRDVDLDRLFDGGHSSSSPDPDGPVRVASYLRPPAVACPRHAARWPRSASRRPDNIDYPSPLGSVRVAIAAS